MTTRDPSEHLSEQPSEQPGEHLSERPTEQPGRPAAEPAPHVVPRWEWRTFGDLAADDELARVRAVPAVESEETYLVSQRGDGSVKVRGGVLDVKALRRVNGAGLQLWEPTTKAEFPVDVAAVTAALDALGLPMPTPRRPRLDYDELVGAAQDSGDLRALHVHKSRHRTVLDGCMVEDTDLTVDGTTTRTVAVESPDPELVVRTVARLGLAGRTNTCVARGLRGMVGWEPPRYAVVDVGTNSVKLTRGLRRPGGPEQAGTDGAVVTRLGEGLAETGVLGAEPMRRTLDAIASLVADARRDGPVEVVAVGTAALRQASNRDELLDAVLARCGVAIEVVPGTEEARLAYLAAVSTLPLTGDRILVFDSGGGSSQFTSGSRDAIDEQFSVDVGAVRVTERYGLAHAVSRETVDAAVAAVARDLDRLAGRPRPDTVVGIGGTATNLAAVHHRLATYDPDVVHGTVLDVAEVDRQLDVYRTRSADQRRAVVGLQPARAEVILAGACVVRAILALTGQQAVTVSDRGLRHGVAAERFGS